MPGNYTRELKRIIKRNKNLEDLKNNLIIFFDKVRNEQGERCYHIIGLALQKRAPIRKRDIDNRIDLIWKTADEWSPKIQEALKKWEDEMGIN